MDKLEAMSDLKNFVIEHGLPRTEITLFGIKCPYCGKSDRIRQLETPDDLKGEPDLERYTQLWHFLVGADAALGMCKFCLNPLKLDLDEGRAEQLFE